MVFRGDKIYMDDVRAAIASLLEELDAHLTGLLLGLSPPSIDVSSLRDDWGCRSPGYSFLSDEANKLRPLREVLLRHVHDDPTLLSGFFTCIQPGNVQVHPGNVESYLRECGDFLSKVSAAVLMTCGNSPRGPEFSGTRLWNSQHSARNVLLEGGCVFLYHTRQKQQQQMGHGKVSGNRFVGQILTFSPSSSSLLLLLFFFPSII